jgi:hypothetical protein
MIYTYVATALIVGIGILFLNRISAPKLLGSALGASILFFLITNFGSWMYNPVYPNNLGGLGASYIAGLPFLSGHLIGNIVYTFVLFTAYELVVNKSLAKVYSF